MSAGTWCVVSVLLMSVFLVVDSWLGCFGALYGVFSAHGVLQVVAVIFRAGVDVFSARWCFGEV